MSQHDLLQILKTGTYTTKQLREKTGLSNSSVVANINRLYKGDFVKREQKHQIYHYSLNPRKK